MNSLTQFGSLAKFLQIKKGGKLNDSMNEVNIVNECMEFKYFDSEGF